MYVERTRADPVAPAAVLNPLVLAIGWLYFGFSTIVLKSQFAHVYYRRNFEMNGRVWYRRILRYSLDICILSSFIMVAFFWVLREFACGGACIPLVRPSPCLKLSRMILTVRRACRSRSPSPSRSSARAGSTTS